MEYVKVEFTRDGTYSDPRIYLQQLPTLATSLPAGARAFATDPEHYNYYGQQCVKDLKPQHLTAGEDNGTSWLELRLRHNCQGWQARCPQVRGPSPPIWSTTTTTGNGASRISSPSA